MTMIYAMQVERQMPAGLDAIAMAMLQVMRDGEK